uniref:MAP7 domain-containing protein 2 n=1 Tax=Caenorhabditis tropicalis TaxID=1561998 RepID=A0A1I7TKT8_9PELO
MDSDEVRKRKEYAERKVKERHAALRKEAEERRKQSAEHRESYRVQSVLKREQVLLQKRMQQLNEDEERKKATLAKQHEATSRIAAINKSPKSFAFGSSTPRTLAYLDNLPKSEQQYDKKLRPFEDSSQMASPTSTSSTTKMGRTPSTPQRQPPAAHRPAPAITSMTSSMYVTSSAPPTRHAKTIAKTLVSTTATSKRLSHGPSMMTQSVYTPSRPATTTRLSMGPRPLRGSTPTSARPAQSRSTAPIATNNRRSLDLRKPPMPRKSTLGKPEVKKQIPIAVDVPLVDTEETSVVVDERQSSFEKAIDEEKATAVKSEKSEEHIVAEENKEFLPEDNRNTENLVEVEETVEKLEDNFKEFEPSNDLVSSHNQVQEDNERIEIPTSNDNTHSSTLDAAHEDNLELNIDPKSVKATVEHDISEKDLVNDIAEEQKEEKIPNEIGEKTSPIETVIHSSNDVEQISPTPDDHSATKESLKQELLNEETSESQLGSSANTSLADELIHIGTDQNESHDVPSKPEVVELEYPLPVEPLTAPAEQSAAENDLVDVFGNDFINQNRPQRMVEFDEETDSGKASPTSSETSSTTDEVTPRNVTDEVKNLAPRVLPIVRSAEDIARKEKEAREAEERKNRLAAILAKSRGMASPMTNTLPPTAADIKDSTNSLVTSPPTPPSPLPVEQPTSSANASTDDSAEKATNESGRSNDVLARVAAMTNSSTLQKILQRKQGSNPSLQTSESTGGEIY